MSLTYLYGDSAPFPIHYNFLATLEGFLECAGKAGRLHHEIEVLESSAAKRQTNRQRLMEALEKFSEGITEDIRKRVEASDVPETLAPYGTQAVESLLSVLERARAMFHDESMRERSQTEASVATKRAEMRTAFDAFLTRNTLTVMTSTFSMVLSGELVTLNATFTLPGGIVAAFELDPQKSARWSQPQRIMDFMPGLILQIGVKKKFLRKTLEPDVWNLDELYLSGIELTDNSCDVHLRRRLDQTADSLVVEMHQIEDEFVAKLRRMEDEEGGRAVDAEPSDLSRLRALWKAIEQHSMDALPHRRRLRAIRLDGEDVVDNGLAILFFDRLIDQLAPIVGEISKRSSSPRELSLKIEREGGRREEIYKKKEELAQLLLSLPDHIFERFAVLDIFPE